MTQPAIDISDLSLSFRNFQALSKISLKVPRGSAMALLGENGAGKTTTLRTLMNIYRADSGSGTILDYPLGEDRPALFQKIGYVSENHELPLNWSVEKLLAYLKPQYPTWDDELCRDLVTNFQLPLKRKLGHLSRGMLMKVALIAGMAYHPELLILDEPFSGLDPLVREELIDAIVELMNGRDWTILLSSHDVHEVERLCDSVTILKRGTVSVSESLDDLYARFRSWKITTEQAVTINETPNDWLLMKQTSETNWSFVESQHHPERSLELIEQTFGSSATSNSSGLSLKDIYLTLARHDKQTRSQILA